MQHKGRDITVPINNERNSLQFSARIFMVEMAVEKINEKEEARVLAFRGSLSLALDNLVYHR